MKLRILAIFNDVKDVDLPSLLEQLVQGHPVRNAIDSTVLEIMGFKKEEIEKTLQELYPLLAREIEKLKTMMEVSLFDQRPDRVQTKVPDFREFRDLVDHIQRDAALIKLLYLGAFRVSEVITYVAPWEETHHKTKAYGKALRIQVEHFKLNEKETVKILLLQSAIAKRTKKQDGKERLTFKKIALPLQPTIYEPWTMDLMEYVTECKQPKLKALHRLLKERGCNDPLIFEKGKKELLERALRFNLSRPAVEYILRQNLRTLLPEKDKHNIRNPLRHWRLTHLHEFYDFDGFDLTQFAGWTSGSSLAGQGASPMLDCYLHRSWKEYFPKLLLPISTVFQVSSDSVLELH